MGGRGARHSGGTQTGTVPEGPEKGASNPLFAQQPSRSFSREVPLSFPPSWLSQLFILLGSRFQLGFFALWGDPVSLPFISAMPMIPSFDN